MPHNTLATAALVRHLDRIDRNDDGCSWTERPAIDRRHLDPAVTPPDERRKSATPFPLCGAPQPHPPRAGARGKELIVWKELIPSLEVAQGGRVELLEILLK
jgi:hypothetical protein